MLDSEELIELRGNFSYHRKGGNHEKESKMNGEEGISKMIVYEHDGMYVMTAQHDHGKISGIFAQQWNDAFFEGKDGRKDVEYAVKNHDVGWIELDQSPLWNEEKQSPYSFTDYPMARKLHYYKLGIQSVEAVSHYAALLCSKHYQSFMSNDSNDDHIQAFLTNERKREKRIYKKLASLPEQQLTFHYDLLQFCDNLSLYICLQEPGIAKSEELNWFKDGFPQTFPFAPTGIYPQWVDDESVRLTPFPFKQHVTVNLRLKRIPTEKVTAENLSLLYFQTPFTDRKVTFIA